GELDALRDAVAGIDCDVLGTKPERATFYQFATLAGLRRSHQDGVARAKAPSGTGCGGGSFLGTEEWRERTVDIGGVLCHSDKRKKYIEWIAEPLLFMGRAEHEDGEALYRWYDEDAPPTREKVTAAMNARSRPPFPTAAEKALMNHVPKATRQFCIRPDADTVRQHSAGGAVAGIACHPDGGPNTVLYYQFRDNAAMRRSFEDVDDDPSGNCLSDPAAFAGNAPYTRPGRGGGRLFCGLNEDDERFMSWTSDRLLIQGYAFSIDDPAAAVEWWRKDGIPV
ncbi:MAG: hypothetical protein ACRDNL_07295, partial [Spirillospora sp.]